MVSASDLKVQVGSRVPFASVTSVTGRVISLAGRTGGGPRFVHLKLARFSGCPVCNLSFREYARHLKDLEAADCEVAIVLHSPKDLVLENQGAAEWASASEHMSWVADPTYELYGAASSGRQTAWRWLLSPKVNALTVQAFVTGAFFGCLCGPSFFRRTVDANLSQVPLDLLVDTRSGTVTALSYGPGVADQRGADWAVAEAKKAAAARP